MSTPSKARRRLRLLPLAVLIVLIPAAMYFWGSHASAFAIERIEVTGAQRVSAAKAADTLCAHFLRHNLFTVKAGDVVRALSAFPYLADVRIDRDFPGTLRVRLVEYRPAACLLAHKRWYIVSQEGRVLLDVTPKRQGQAASAGGVASAAPAPGAAGLAQASPGAATTATPSPRPTPAWATGSSQPNATTTSSTTGTVTTGALVATVLPQTRRLPILRSSVPVRIGQLMTDQRVRDSLAVLRALPAAVRARVAEVRAATSSLTVTTRDGLRLEFGTTAALQAKVLALQAVLGAYRRHHVPPTYIDVSVPNRPLGTPVLIVRATTTLPAWPAASSSPTASRSPSPSPRATSTPSSKPSPTGTRTPATPKPTATAKD